MTFLPENLKNAIAEESQRYNQRELSQAREDLSNRYRNRESNSSLKFIETASHRNAYLISRLPATWGVVRRVLFELQKVVPDLNPETLLDLGAGPGTAAWAAADVFSSLNRAILIEQDREMLTMGQRLIKHSSDPFLKDASWINDDISKSKDFPDSDLIVCSYAIGELSPSVLNGLMNVCWKATKKALVFIEPGTPRGFEKILLMRTELIRQGAYIAAPCPHMRACPMPPNDWCHFSERIQRSSQHRMAKKGTLGYEDEKFSYIIGIKNPITVPNSRIIRHPQIHKGHISIKLCHQGCLIDKTISKKDGELYKLTKKLEWGDSFNL